MQWKIRRVSKARSEYVRHKLKFIPSILTLSFAIIFGNNLPAYSQQQTTIGDGDFNITDWTSQILTPPSVLANSAGGQQTTPGWPGNYRRVDHNYSNENATVRSTILVAHIRDTQSYDPASDGAISQLGYSFSLGEYDDDWPESGAHCMSYKFLIRQANTFYKSGNHLVCEAGPPRHGTQDTMWIDVSSPSPLTADNFERVSASGPEKPDFSCDGSAIEFGYLTSNSTGGVQQRTIRTRSGLDNYSVKINSNSCAPPPDPCCPPWNGDTLKAFVTQTSNAMSPSAPFHLSYGGITADFHQQMQHYTNYVSSILPTNQLTITFFVTDHGLPAPGTDCRALSGPGTEIAPRRYLRWTANAGPDPDVLGPNTTGQTLTGFWSATGPQAQQLQPGRCYRLTTSISLPNKQQFFPDRCKIHQSWYWRDRATGELRSAAIDRG